MSQMMKAAIYHGLESMQIEEVPVPACGNGEILIRVEACGVCGSDARIYYQGHREVRPPQIIGHEIAGTVVAVGSGSSGYDEGEHVTVTPEVTCGRCRFCLQGRQNMCTERKALGLSFAGGFAQHMLIPAAAVRGGNVIKLPPTVSLDEAALIEPIACCLNAQSYLHMGPADRVVVIGAGAMGCIFLALARICGASQTIVVNARSRARLLLARRIGADHYLSAEEGDPVAAVTALTGGDGADVVIVAANAAAAQEQAIMMAGKQGRVCLFAGLPAGATPQLDCNRIHYNEISVYGAFSSTRHQADRALALISTKTLDAGLFITHRLPLDDVVRGITMKRTGESIKAVVQPWADAGGQV